MNNVSDMRHNLNNRCNGMRFQNLVKDWFCKNKGSNFETEIGIHIGCPPKIHRFDIVNSKKKIAIECKSYSWTETDNVPSAKIDALNVAAFYLSLLPKEYDKYIVILRSISAKRNESLAEYYFRTNGHLIGEIKIAEYDTKNSVMRVIKK